MKRFCGLFLTVVILMGALLSGNVFAVEAQDKIEVVFPGYENNSGPSYEALDAYVDDMASLRKTLTDAFAECREEIYLLEYGIPAALIDQLAFYVWKEIPEAFHVGVMSYSSSAGKVDTLYVAYTLNKSDYGSLLKQCRDVAEKMLEGVDDPRLSDAEKALILHDRLALHNEYDLTYNAPYTHEMVGALVNQTSVCEGYAMAYSYLLDQVGIRNYYCQSERINHGWNILYIDGVKYHVDVTWDDPIYDRMGRVYHTNFLRSTEGMEETGHHINGACDYDDTPQDTRYDAAYWQNSLAAFQVLDGKLYYVSDSGDHADLMQVSSGEHQAIADVSDAWVTHYGNWGDGYQSLSSDGQDLLYSGKDKIYRYCTETGQTEAIWTPSLPDGTAIFGFKLWNNTLMCVYSDSPNFDVDTNHTNLMEQSYGAHTHAHEHIFTGVCDEDCNICGENRTPPHEYDGESDLTCNLCGYERPAYIPGDVDNSGKVDLDDAIYLLYYVNFPSAYPVSQPVDFDGSGRADLNDAIYLLYHVNFPAQYPLQ